MQESAVARLVKAGILPQKRWKYSAGDEALNGAIGESRSVAFAITGRTLAVSRLAVLRLADPSE
jgi:hypothetical protein